MRGGNGEEAGVGGGGFDVLDEDAVLAGDEHGNEDLVLVFQV